MPPCLPGTIPVSGFDCGILNTVRSKCLVVAGGVAGFDLVQSRVAEGVLGLEGYGFVIAADGGQTYSDALAMMPNIVVGDFDSSSRPEGRVVFHDGKTRGIAEMEARISLEAAPGDDSHSVTNDTEITVIVLPQEKEVTDSEAAIDLAFERGFREIDVLGGLSGRLDHTLGNLGLLEKYLGHANVRFFDGYNSVTLLGPGRHLVHRQGYRYFGAIPFGGDVSGLTLRGMKYEVTDFTLPQATTRGVSNEIVGETAEVVLQTGCLLAICSSDQSKIDR